MNRNRRSSIVSGIILILLGLLFLANEIFPELFSFWEWPVLIIGMGFVFLLWAILSGIGGLAVPAAIIGGIGGIFYYQNMTGNWESWSYIWSLIPGFVGVGIILSGIIDRSLKEALSGGLTMIIISGVLFFAFGTAFGIENDFFQYWPILLIALGLISLVRVLFSNKQKRA